ncbi:hypothetical protein [Nesterenkonia haasae]|uniref:hypothetical protein n=1 Tax=Nesterenkonia haasae TaxID=2587813 RepID=UPI0013907D7E|nr:hypothetical protein [Nesterenkonia haasae]NDK32456.1 hypothetical protein [Nesterenkonia haasae]
MDHTEQAKKKKSRTLVIGVIVVAVSLLLTAVIYGWLIWSNCNSDGIADFFADVRDFHTSYDGCDPR